MNRIFLIFFLCFCSNLMLAQHSDWIVKFDKKPYISNVLTRSSIFRSIEVLSPTLNVYNLKTNQDVTKDYVFQQLFNVQSVSYNAPIEKRSVTPNDILFDGQWNLKIVEADRVWEETTGGSDFEGNDVVIAVLDDGFDSNHEDLLENYWINKNEIPGDNIDNDNNGFIDDVMGVNIQNNTGTHPGVTHGTKVTGILGATGDNGLGIAGVNWNTKILLVSGVGNVGQIIEGLEYLYTLKKKYIDTNGQEGANIVVNNLSGGLSFRFPDQFPSWCEQYDHLGSVGILSVGSVANADIDVEIEGDMPTLCTSDHLIMVTNTNSVDVKVTGSAYGITSVDLAAPGESVVTTDIGNDYGEISGTSASAPHVAGAISLLYTVSCDGISQAIASNPSSFALSVKNAIMESVDKLPSLENTVTQGRLNIFNAVFELNEICGSANLEELNIKNIKPNFFTSQNSPNTITVEYGTDVFKSHSIFIHNSTGQLVYKNDFNPNIFGIRSQQVKVNGNLPAGTYILSIVESDRIASEKFVVVD